MVGPLPLPTRPSAPQCIVMQFYTVVLTAVYVGDGVPCRLSCHTVNMRGLGERTEEDPTSYICCWQATATSHIKS